MYLGGYLISPLLQFDGVVSPNQPSGVAGGNDGVLEGVPAPNKALFTIGAAPREEKVDDVDLDVDDPGHGRRTRRRRVRGQRGESSARSRPVRRGSIAREIVTDQEEVSDIGPVVPEEGGNRVRDPRLRPKPKPAKRFNM